MKRKNFPKRKAQRLASPLPLACLAKGHTDKRIIKLHKAGLTPEQIARKIGRPGDVERLRGDSLRDNKSKGLVSPFYTGPRATEGCLP
jgi:hypothetical protein